MIIHYIGNVCYTDSVAKLSFNKYGESKKVSDRIGKHLLTIKVNGKSLFSKDEPSKSITLKKEEKKDKDVKNVRESEKSISREKHTANDKDKKV